MSNNLLAPGALIWHPNSMQKRSSSNEQLENMVIQAPASLDEVKNQAAVMLGRLGGLKGGKARAEKLSPRKRSQIARRAAQARWSREKS